MITSPAELAAAKKQFEETSAKIEEAVTAVKKMVMMNPKFAVISCIPSAHLAEFIIATSVQMQNMAEKEFVERMRAQQQGEASGQ